MAQQLGHLEETILLIIMGEDQAYGVSIAEAYQQQYEQPISIPTIHTVLKRLEKKGLVTSSWGEVTAERGGRRKRLYQATSYGFLVINKIREHRMSLWAKIPQLMRQNG